MKLVSLSRGVLCLLALALVLPGLAAAAPTNTLVEIENTGNALILYPVVEYDRMILTVTGPCGYEFRKVIRRGEFVWKLDETTIDGAYRFNVMREEKVSSEVRDILKRARLENDAAKPKELCREGRLPAPPLAQSLGFIVDRGEILWDPFTQEDRGASGVSSVASGGFGAAGNGDSGIQAVSAADFVINDDLIVDGSACIGFDCVNGEVFSFDTIRLKENNLRIKFDDTSTVPSFPANDWQITANESANGGASKFSIEDVSGSRTPFTIEANARSHSLYVDDGGRIGSRTSTPSVEIHTIDGDTPTLRLQQDGSSGFEPQTWDVAGNETNFFIRDVTNGSTLPLRIRPGAPSNAIFVDVDGDVGMGTSSPDADLDIQASGPTMKWTNTGAGGGVWEFFVNANTSRLNLRFDGANIPFKLDNGANDNLFRVGIDGAGGVAGDTVSIGSDAVDAVLDVRGSIEVDGAVVHADYVFEEDYSLKSIEDQAAFMWENKHLPSLPKAPEGLRGKVDLVGHQMGMLEELEKAHIYIEQLNNQLKSTQSELEQALEAKNTALETMQERLDRLERLLLEGSAQ